MNHILICLVGDQTVPNVLLIKDTAFQQIDSYTFITTELMEARNRLQHIINATGLKANQYQKLIVKADELQAIHEKLERLHLNNSNTQYYINITSGTKLMSIALYDYFSQEPYKSCSRIFYMPIGKNAFIQSYPNKKKIEYAIQYRIPVNTYLTSYGIRIDNCKTSQSLHMPPEFTLNFMQEQSKFPRVEIDKLRKNYNSLKSKPEVYIPPSPSLQAFLNKVHYPIANNGTLNKADIHYLIGGWFEEWTFYMIKQKYMLADNDILCNVSISRLNEAGETVNNECDVLFTYQNTLHVVECKTGISRGNLKPMFYEALYKLNTLKNEFGQRVHAHFYTLTNLRNQNGQLKSFIARHAALYRIEVLDEKDLSYR